MGEQGPAVLADVLAFEAAEVEAQFGERGVNAVKPPLSPIERHEVRLDHDGRGLGEDPLASLQDFGLCPLGVDLDEHVALQNAGDLVVEARLADGDGLHLLHHARPFR